MAWATFLRDPKKKRKWPEEMRLLLSYLDNFFGIDYTQNLEDVYTQMFSCGYTFPYKWNYMEILISKTSTFSGLQANKSMLENPKILNDFPENIGICKPNTK